MSSRKVSSVWLHYTKVAEQQVQCNICQKRLTYKGSSTSNLQKHISSVHWKDTATLPDKVRRRQLGSGTVASGEGHVAQSSTSITNTASATSASAISSASSTAAATVVTSVVTTTGFDAVASNSVQTSIEGFLQRPMTALDKAKTDQALLKLVVGDLLPFSIVDGRAFRELMALIAPNYEVPCRTTISRTFMPRKYEEVRAKVRRQLDGVEAITLTTDLWTSRTTKAYIAVTGHFISQEWTMDSALLGCIPVRGSHTAAMIRNELKQVNMNANIIMRQLSWASF